jgi:hypothetical protein
LLNIEGVSADKIKELAYETGFVKRISKKIEAEDFFALICLESQKGSPSYNDIAARYETLYGNAASKQAICKKFNPDCVIFFQSVLGHIIKSKVPLFEIEELKKLKAYKRVLVQDSTIIKLPQCLSKEFAGVTNRYSTACNARIQGVYDLISGEFIYFTIDPYSKNDISSAPDLELLDGDLSLRDRGYLSNAEIKRHTDIGADCIYRFKHNTTLLDSESLNQINVLKLLKNKVSLDMTVCLNNDSHTKVRLIAMPVSIEVANKRRMKAKKEFKGHSPSPELLDLMSWTIFLTTIPSGVANFYKIFTLYSLRWRIEIIFKSWKSHMQFAKVHNVSENQLRVLLTARFIMIVVCIQIIYNPLSYHFRKIYNKELSLLKLINYLIKNTEKLIELLSAISGNDCFRIKKIEETLIRYCSYDKRKRLNFNQISQIALA